MPRENFNDLLAFIAVAREHSFTRAAGQLGVSQSALSHSIRSLESRLGVRLLTRTTRSVSTTAPGERLLQSVAPQFEEIEAELSNVGELRDKPAGTLRITATEHAANTVLWPRLVDVLPRYPDIRIEVCIDYGLTDIVANRFDAGIRPGDQVAKDMTAVRIGPDMPMAVVATPGYFATRPQPAAPQELTGHCCINLRLPTQGGLYAWEFKKGRRSLQVRVNGQLVLDNVAQIVATCLAGFGIGYVPLSAVDTAIAQGQLVRVLADWSPVFPGYHLYYPNSRHSSRALAVLVEALRENV
ncbi:LysR family transcriptional regulator [Cupriavidus sp. 2TAF22]|uniref:LysR family transcriptional regulator n=1 Tax=unclassified Cupriavidus TaxID=2640874 RepID=UPI003F9279F1